MGDFFTWSRLGERLRRSPIRSVTMPAKDRKEAGEDIALLAGGLPHESLFPIKKIDVHLNEAFEMPLLDQALQYTPGGGIMKLRETLATLQRKVHCECQIEHVCATVGSTDGIVKVMELLTDEGDDVFMEEYTWAGALAIASSRGRNTVSCPVDEKGLSAKGLDDALSKKNKPKKKRVLYTISSGHNPLGVTAPLDRKKEIYQVCQKHDVIILEDDPYYYLAMSASEKSPLEKLQGSYLSLDEDKRVIRLDSFAKIISPGMRLGSVTCRRPEFIQKYMLLSEQSTQHPSGLAQATFVGLFEKWGFDGFETHLANIQAEYLRRRDVLITALDDALKPYPGLASYNTPTEGMFLWLDQAAVPETKDLASALVDAGVAAIPGIYFRTSDCGGSLPSDVPCPYLRLTFASATDHDLINGAHRIVKCLANVSINGKCHSSATNGHTPTTPNGHSSTIIAASN